MTDTPQTETIDTQFSPSRLPVLDAEDLVEILRSANELARLARALSTA